MKRKTYYSLLVRDDRASNWQIHFGDYEKTIVRQEQTDICQIDYKKINTKIIATGDTQADINAAVTRLNAPFDPPFTVIHMTPNNVQHVHNTIAEALGQPKLNSKD